MKLQQSVNLLLVALLVWAFQTNTIHINDHRGDKISECKLCEISKHFEPNHKSTSVTFVNEILAIQMRNPEEESVVVVRFNDTDLEPLWLAESINPENYRVEKLCLGYFSTAPPLLT